MKETPEHIKIFELYYSMDNDRSLSKLREKLMSPECPQSVPSLKTLKRWSVAFNWQERIEQRDIENSKTLKNKLSKKVDRIKVNSKADYRALVKKVVIEFEKRLKAGKIIISKPQDLNIMAQLDLLLMGEVTERDEIIVIRPPKEENETNSESGKSKRNN